MAVLTKTPDSSKLKRQASSSWDQIKNLVTCRSLEDSNIHQPSNKCKSPSPPIGIYSSCSKICTFRDTRIIDKLPEKKSGGGGMQLRKLTGCHECRVIVDSRRPLPLPRTSVFSCSQCGEIFPKIESLELHQAVRHAVSELGADDSSRNIVEIIFKSSWLKKENPVCEIERILKVHNTPSTIQRFEDYRDSIKQQAKRNARCAADGNELLRFQAATIMCRLGANGSTSLCSSTPACGICTTIRHGFRCSKTRGICTTASSGRADTYLGGGGSCTRRAMLVCRVIAGRVKPRMEEEEVVDVEGNATQVVGSYDSLAGCAGAYSDLEELFVFSSRAILPCFVVIYKALE